MSDRGTLSSDSAMDDAKSNKKEHKVSLLKLFSFADFYDYVLMGVGSVGAIVHGASIPIFFIFFRKLINVIGLAYIFPKEASHKVAKYSLDFVSKYSNIVFIMDRWLVGEHQDISLFDTEASTGEVISAITNDIIIVQDALSEKNFMVGLPSVENREKILRTLLAKEKVDNELDFKELATLTEGYTEWRTHVGANVRKCGHKNSFAEDREPAHAVVTIGVGEVTSALEEPCHGGLATIPVIELCLQFLQIDPSATAVYSTSFLKRK